MVINKTVISQLQTYYNGRSKVSICLLIVGWMLDIIANTYNGKLVL